MPRYYVPPAPGTRPERIRPVWQLLLLAIGLLLLLGLLLTRPGHEILGILGVFGAVLLYLLFLLWPYLLLFGLLLYAVSRLGPRPRRPPRPAPTWLWQPWEIMLSLAVVLLALGYYAVADGSRWLWRRWRRRGQRRAAGWKARQPM